MADGTEFKSRIGSSFFGAPTGAALPETTGSQFEEGIVSGVERQLKPRFEAAQQGLGNVFASRGLAESGVSAAAGGQLRETFLDRLADAATAASTRGAILSEEARQAELNRDFQRKRREQSFEFARQQQKTAEGRARNAAFSDALGVGAKGFAGLISDFGLSSAEDPGLPDDAFDFDFDSALDLPELP